MRFMPLASLIIASFIVCAPSFAQNSRYQGTRQDKRARIQEIRKAENIRIPSLSEQEKRSLDKYRKERFESFSNEKKKSIRDHRAKQQELKNMTSEERKSYMQTRRTKWNTLSNEEKQTKRSTMTDRWSKLPPEVREKRKARFKNMPEDRKAAFKERHPLIYQDITSGE